MVPKVPKTPGNQARSPEERTPKPVIFRARVHYGSPLFGYVLSLALTSVAGVLRLSLMQYGDFIFPFVFFQPAIALSSFLGGTGPGLVAVVAGAVFGAVFFPYHPAPASWIGFAVVGPLMVSGFAHLRFIRDRHVAIARELANFKLIGDHASDWILLLDEGGLIQYVNLKASTDLGCSDRELTGRQIESLVPESQRSILRTVLDKARAGTGAPVELTFERRDKSPLLVELNCTGVRTADGLVVYAAARDIGERKQIEKKLREIRHWESLGALAGGLAHDFNNLLTIILGNASLARDLMPGDHAILPMVDGIVSAAERSSELVRMLLATSGYRSRYGEPLRLDQLLEWTLANRPLPSHIRIATDTVEMPFMGDRRSFETLLWSLISNAAEAYGPKEGEVRVAIRSGAALAVPAANFQEGDSGTGECLGIIVEDSGSGMSPEILDRAFDPFFSTRFTGRGLGLPAVRGIVRAYSGKLLINTAVGRGTRVEVWLPFKTAAVS